MTSYLEDKETPYQVNPETPDRPPQLNEAIKGCGCRCRTRGTDGEDDERSNDEDDASTLVTSDQDLDSGFPPSSDGPEPHVSVALFQPAPLQGTRQLSEGGTRIGIFENGVDGFQPSQPVVGIMEPVWPHRMPSFYEERADSLKNEYGSENHSVVEPDARTLSSMSPGPYIGVWSDEELRLAELHIHEYHFLVRPLRLTPQYRYCRGLVTSHMVVPDEDFFRRAG
jgi:hypothetical protein